MAMSRLRCGLPLTVRLGPVRTLPERSCSVVAGHLLAPSRFMISHAATQYSLTACWQEQQLPLCQRHRGAAAAAASSSAFSSGISRHASQRHLCTKCRAAAGATAKEGTPQLAGPPAPGSGAYGMPPPPGGKRMILTDAMAILYRSHYAFSEAHRLRNAAGKDTTVLFGFLNTLLNLLELTPPPTHFVVVLDAHGKTFRHEIYEGYKGQRLACPDAVKEAVPRLHQLLKSMAIPVIQVPGVEADDVIGTMAYRAVQEGIAVAVASPDKDFFQLLRPGIILLRPPKKPGPGKRVNKYALVPYSQADFEEEFGLQPEQFVDMLALAGDASDNVPGVSGIGPKTAVALLKQYDTLDNVLDHAEEAKPKKAALQLASAEGRAAARLSQQLVRIETALDMPPVKEPLDQLRLQLPADRGVDLLRQFQELEFSHHTSRVKDLWASELYRL